MSAISYYYSRIRIILIMFLVILNSGYALSLGNQTLIMYCNVLFLFIDLVLSGEKTKLEKRLFLFIVLLLLQFFITIIVNMDFAGYKEYVRLTIVIVFSYYVFSIFSVTDIVNAFCVFMYYASLASLVFYLAVIIFPNFGIVLENGYGTLYKTCFVSFVNVVTQSRNCGLFWEPSVFAAVCFIWGILEICVVKNIGQRKFRIVVLFLSVFSTYSTSGYVYLIFLISLLLTHNDSKKINAKKIVFILIGSFFIIVFYYNYDELVSHFVALNPLVFKKLLYKNESVTDRTIGPLADLYVAVRNPFGVGITALTSSVEKVANDVFSTVLYTRTSSITYYCAAFGMCSGIQIIVSLIRFAQKHSRNFLTFTIMIVGIVLMSCSSPLYDSTVFIMLLLMGMTKKISFGTDK